MDDPDDLALAEADPKRLLEADPPILLDEWQRLPETWDLVRRAVDAGSEPGRYLLTGLARIVDRDFAELRHELRNPLGLRRWMTAYAAASSTTTSFEKIRDAATGGEGEKPSRRGAAPYRNVLERLWILDPVPAWQPTRRHLSRLSAAPKHQLADST